jgi:protein TonB
LLTQSAQSSQTPDCKKIEFEGRYISISQGVAEKLLITKVEPVWKHLPMEASVSGTVVVKFQLGKHGEVLCPMIVSGPLLLKQPVLDAVRKYKYKPYLLNGEAVLVSTAVSITASNY